MTVLPEAFEFFSPERAPDVVVSEDSGWLVAKQWRVGESTVIVKTYDDEWVDEEWYLGDPDEKILHRVGAPAHLAVRNGSMSEVAYAMRGKVSRFGGPGLFYFGGSELISSFYVYDGQESREIGEWVKFLVEADPGTLLDDLRVSGFEGLLDDGASVPDLLEVFRLGVLAPSGVREVLGGAPVEWVRSFESGEVAAGSSSACG